MRDRQELNLSINTGDSYIDSASQLDDINEGYQATADSHDWPSLLTRVGIAKVANVDRYGLPGNFRKARTVKFDGITLHETEQDFIRRTRHSFVIDQVQDDIITNPIPSAASDAFTLDDAESAGNAVTIGLDTVSGLSQHDEIWIDSASDTDEFSLVSSVDSSAVEIVARLDSAKSAGDVIYRVLDIIDIKYYRFVTLLSAAGDVTLLPGSLDFIIVKKATSIAFARLEQFAESDKWNAMWERDLAAAWLASDLSSTGASNQFSA